MTRINIIFFDNSNNSTESLNISNIVSYLWYPYTIKGVLCKHFPPMFRLSMDPLNALPFLNQLFVTKKFFTESYVIINVSCDSSNNEINDSQSDIIFTVQKILAEQLQWVSCI